MKKVLLVFLAINGLFIGKCLAQDNTLAASKRKAQIGADWTDRAQISGTDVRPQGKNLVWARRSAKVWEEAHPVGNGKLGAMIFGGVADERLQLNENTVWGGEPLDPNNPEGLKALPEIQRLLFENKNNEAVRLAEQTMMGRPAGVHSYKSLGELWFDTPELSVGNYVRSLDLSTAVVTVGYTAEGVKYTREYFASAVDNVIVVRIGADTKRKSISTSHCGARWTPNVAESPPTPRRCFLPDAFRPTTATRSESVLPRR